MIAVVASTLAFLASYALARVAEATSERQDVAGAVFIAALISINAATIALV